MSENLEADVVRLFSQKNFLKYLYTRGDYHLFFGLVQIKCGYLGMHTERTQVIWDLIGQKYYFLLFYSELANFFLLR